ncbi:hypothetical protein BDV97DRAFT_5715 [Delphinella strobiligena]|nr:hypothetical protein BDV97DRAFT_5715 [Delphinella strobiligena]
MPFHLCICCAILSRCKAQNHPILQSTASIQVKFCTAAEAAPEIRPEAFNFLPPTHPLASSHSQLLPYSQLLPSKPVTIQHNDHPNHIPPLNHPPLSLPRRSHPCSNRASPLDHLRLHVHRHLFQGPMQQFLRLARSLL